MIIEEILVNEVFQFEVSENIDNAIARLVGYISREEKPLKAYSKLASRLEQTGSIELADKVVDKVCRFFPPASLSAISETDPSCGETPIDWVATWRAAVARSYSRRKNFNALHALLPEDLPAADLSYSLTLAILVDAEKNSGGESPTLLRLLDDSGMPLPHLIAHPVITLLGAQVSHKNGSWLKIK